MSGVQKKVATQSVRQLKIFISRLEIGTLYFLFLELIESTMYLYQATNDPYFLEVGRDILHSIETICRTECGYATVRCRPGKFQSRNQSNACARARVGIGSGHEIGHKSLTRTKSIVLSTDREVCQAQIVNLRY